MEPTLGPAVTTAPSTALRVWKQIGSDIDFYGSEVVMSKDGKRIAVLASYSVRVYQFDKNFNNWIQLGSVINGSGSLSISHDGNRIVTFDSSVRARIYKWDGDVESDWIKMGSDIFVEDSSSVASVSISADGRTVAIGASFFVVNDDISCGNVRMCTWDETGSDWTQLGLDIDGAGSSVSISGNGKFVTIGAPYKNNGTGQVRVYKWNNDLYFIGGSPSTPTSVYRWNLDEKGPADILACSSTLSFSDDVISVPEKVEFPTTLGTAHGYYYPPKNGEFTCTTEKAPPLLVKAHKIEENNTVLCIVYRKTEQGTIGYIMKMPAFSLRTFCTEHEFIEKVWRTVT